MNADPQAPVTRRWKAIGLLCLVFVLGAVTGVGGGALVLRRVIQSRIASDATSMPMLDRAEREIISKLDLTPGEREAVKAELAVTRGNILEYRKNSLSDIRMAAEDTLDRIKSHLPAEKQAVLDRQARKRFAPWGVLRQEDRISPPSR